MPEDDGVDVDRNHGVEDWDDGEKPRTPHALQLSHSQNHKFLPHIGHFQRRGDKGRKREQRDAHMNVAAVANDQSTDGKDNTRKEVTGFIWTAPHTLG